MKMSRKEMEEFFNSMVDPSEFRNEQEYRDSLEIFINAFESSNKALSKLQHDILSYSHSYDLEKIKKSLKESTIKDIIVFQKNSTYFLDITALQNTSDEDIKLAIEASIQLKPGAIRDLGDELSLYFFNILLEKEEIVPCSLIATFLSDIKNKVLAFDLLRKKCAEIEDYDRAAIYRDKVIFLKKYQHQY